MKTSAIRRKTVGNTSRSCCQDISSSSGETATTKGATASNTGRATPQFSHLSHHRRRHHHLHPFRPPSLVTPTAELMGPFPRVKLPLKFLNGSKVPPRRLIRKRRPRPRPCWSPRDKCQDLLELCNMRAENAQNFFCCCKINAFAYT